MDVTYVFRQDQEEVGRRNAPLNAEYVTKAIEWAKNKPRLVWVFADDKQVMSISNDGFTSFYLSMMEEVLGKNRPAWETWEGYQVDTSVIPLSNWDGCCWVYPDGRIIAVNYAGHKEWFEAAFGKYEYDGPMTEHRLLHVSGWTHATKSPTRVQKDVLAALAARFDKVKESMKRQGWKVEDYKTQKALWAV